MIFIQNELYNCLYYFIIYAFLGWVLEVSYRVLNTGKFSNRGFLIGAYCPIYGIGAILALYLIKPFKNNIVMLFIVSFIITSILEFVTGFVLEKIFKYKWWNYSDLPFNIKGYICLKFSIIWGLACIFLINTLSPLVEKFVLWTPFFIGIATIYLVLIIMLIDFLITVANILYLSIKLRKKD